MNTSPATTARGRLLIVDDEPLQLRALCDTLEIEGYSIRGFGSPREALAALRPGDFDLLLTDLMMPEMDGIELIAAIRGIDPDVGAVVMTGHGTIDTAVQAMQGGALDYILKPFSLNIARPVISRALNLQRLKREVAQLQAAERQRAEELAAAYADLESFSYSISHDLRAPLLFVKDFAQRLHDDHADRLGEEGGHIVQVIHDGAQSMDRMIVGLLAFSRSTRQPLQLSRVEMQPIVRAVIAEARALYPDTDPRVEVGPLPAAMADPGVIRHVWANLVSNALKFSSRQPDPRVRIGASVEGGQVTYSVEDNGVGFDARHADKLFGVFKRLHSVDDFPGTGVGLAIAHRILARHGGRIRAESEPGKGACFRFTLPLAREDNGKNGG
jgi:two-component system sensor histidine kinase/response regulator